MDGIYRQLFRSVAQHAGAFTQARYDTPPIPRRQIPIINTMVQTLPFGNVQVPIPGFGAMGLSSSMGTKLNSEQAEPVLQKAVDLGCTFWDTAASPHNPTVGGETLTGCRSLTGPARTKNFWVTSFGKITSAISFLVSYYFDYILCGIQ